MAYQEKPFVQQPGAQQQMSVNRLNPLNVEVGADGKRAFSHGLFDCFADITTCCVSCWLPCITYGDIKQRLVALNNGAPASSTEMVNGDCLVFGGIQYCVGFGFILEMLQRGEIRERYHVAGSGGSDCLLSCYCMPCVMTQNHREIKAEEQALMQKY